MTTQEEWRKIAYERWVGETGNSSIGTTANQKGYETYLGEQKAQHQFHKDIQSTFSSFPTTSTSYSKSSNSSSTPAFSYPNSYVGSVDNHSSSGISTRSNWFPFVDDFVESLPKWIHGLLSVFGVLIGYGYVSYSLGRFTIESTDAFFNYYALAMTMGFFSGLLFIPLVALTVKLVLTAIILGLMAGGLYLVYSVYQHWPW